MCITGDRLFWVQDPSPSSHLDRLCGGVQCTTTHTHTYCEYSEINSRNLMNRDSKYYKLVDNNTV